MNKEELIAALEQSRESMSMTLDRLTDDQYLEPGVSGDRSVKDLLAHLAIWEAQVITLLFRAFKGAKPNTAQFSKESRAAFNARWQAEHADRPLEKVVEDFEGIREQTIRRVEELSDADLNDPKRFPWLAGRPLWQWILKDTVEHEARHRKEIETWLRR